MNVGRSRDSEANRTNIAPHEVKMKTDNTLGDGVYFAMEDYAGFVRRFIALTVDSTILLAIGIVLWLGLISVFWNPDSEDDPTGIFWLIWFGIAWLYLVPLKRSDLGTVAFRLLDIKILTTKGQRPSLITMTFRMMLWLFGPFNFLLDLLWLGADSEQQTLRDCYAGTYVVRRSAEPIGVAPIHLAHYCGAGMTLVYPRVVRPTVAERHTAS